MHLRWRPIRMKMLRAVGSAVVASVLLAAGWPINASTSTRINRIIERLAHDQPVYYTGSHSGTSGSFEQGKADAQTYADYLNYDMEHAPFDVKSLAEYMKGLAAAGPTRSGHSQGVGRRLSEGRRGAHGSPPAAEIWGLTQDEYNQRADVWPLNPNGELILGLKLEDKYALRNADANLRVPGIGFAEWGPGDMTLSLGALGPGALARPEIQAARNEVLAATRARKVFFLESMSPATVIASITEGVRLGPADRETAEIGRAFTNRRLPW